MTATETPRTVPSQLTRVARADCKPTLRVLQPSPDLSTRCIVAKMDGPPCAALHTASSPAPDLSSTGVRAGAPDGRRQRVQPEEPRRTKTHGGRGAPRVFVRLRASVLNPLPPSPPLTLHQKPTNGQESVPASRSPADVRPWREVIQRRRGHRLDVLTRAVGPRRGQPGQQTFSNSRVDSRDGWKTVREEGLAFAISPTVQEGLERRGRQRVDDAEDYRPLRVYHGAEQLPQRVGTPNRAAFGGDHCQQPIDLGGDAIEPALDRENLDWPGRDRDDPVRPGQLRGRRQRFIDRSGSSPRVHEVKGCRGEGLAPDPRVVNGPRKLECPLGLLGSDPGHEGARRR